MQLNRIHFTLHTHKQSIPFLFVILIFQSLSVASLSLLPFSSANGGSHHVVRAEAAEDADGADHLPVQVCLPGPHPVPQEFPPHLRAGPMTFGLTRRGRMAADEDSCT